MHAMTKNSISLLWNNLTLINFCLAIKGSFCREFYTIYFYPGVQLVNSGTTLTHKRTNSKCAVGTKNRPETEGDFPVSGRWHQTELCFERSLAYGL